MASQMGTHHQAQLSNSSVADSPASSRAPTPAASSNGPVVPPTALNKPQRILACVLCQHRKIKCDRTFPCANCIKANVTCTPSTPAPARKRRRPNQDLQERLARCEELLKEYATAKPDSPPAEKPPTLNPPDHIPEIPDDLTKWKPAGKLIEEDGGVRFMDSYLLTTVYDELKSMRKIVDEEIASDEPTPMPIDDTVDTPDDNADLIFGTAEDPDINPEDLAPSPAHIILLWQMYLDRCNPLTKIIHVPTLQPYVLEATGPSPQLPKNVEALLFSIYLLATVSMRKDECEETIGMSRDKALARFGHGVRLALSRKDFLKTHDLTTLQALVIYLISLQGRYNRHASWILNGLVIRIAQKMGLHRDGEHLGLKPFETEMRRRLWWQIILVDAKYAMMSGLSHTLLPRGWNTKEPKNINDEGLLPSATIPTKDSGGPTDMVLVVVICKITKALIHLPGIETILMLNEMDATKGSSLPNKLQVQEYVSVVKKLDQEIDEFLDKNSSPDAGPLHTLARSLKNHLLGKLTTVGTSPADRPDWGTEVFDHTSNTFKLAVETTSHSVEQYKMGNYPGWDWYSRLHFQIDVFAYLVGQLCHRTAGPLVDKAWRVVEDVYKYHPEFYEVATRKMYYQLAHFVFKAWRKREQVLRARLGTIPETPQCVLKLRLLTPGSDDTASVKSESGTTPQNGMFNYNVPNAQGGAAPGSAMDYTGAGGVPFDAYMGDYFDFNTALDFDVWSNPPAMLPSGMPMDPMNQPNQPLGDMMPYGLMGQGQQWQ